MFVSLPTRTRPSLRWATPMLFALLWLAYLWASTRPGAAQHALVLDWGALTGGQALADTLRALWTEGRGLRLLVLRRALAQGGEDRIEGNGGAATGGGAGSLADCAHGMGSSTANWGSWFDRPASQRAATSVRSSCAGV